MSNKQSSIEWLVSQILVEYATYFNEEGDLVDKPINQFFNAYQGSVNLIEYVNKAKEMHKQEIYQHAINFYLFVENDEVTDQKVEIIENLYKDYLKQFYNETFGK